MTRRIVRLLLVLVVLSNCVAMSSSCSILGPIVGLPVRLAGGALRMVGSNPVGAAAAAATVF
jgi:hypothetical protein